MSKIPQASIYRRSVDDTFILSDQLTNAPIVSDLLNKQHPSIKFTAEPEKENWISFSDVKVCKTKQSFDARVFRKISFTGLGLKHDSAMSNRYKFYYVICLINRAYKTCKNYPKFLTELDLKGYFYTVTANRGFTSINAFVSI